MPAPVRRPPAPAVIPVDFGGLDFYQGGGDFNLPEGKYACYFDILMHRFTKQDGSPGRGPEALKVRVSAHSLADPQQEPTHVFYLSMGKKAHLSFQPNPETGKGLVAVPGGPATTANDSTNWAIFLKHFYDCGLPAGIFTNDLTAIDGVWLHLQNIPEPAERQGMSSGPKTGEAAEPERKLGVIPVPTEILDGGKPWESTGGLPEGPVEEEAAPAPPKAGPRPVAPKAPAPKKAPAKVAVAAEEGDEDMAAAAVTAVASVLERNPKGVPKMILRGDTFKALGKSAPDHQQTVMSTYFSSDDALNGLLQPLGFQVSGVSVVPV